jgi:hypothetical protein
MYGLFDAAGTPEVVWYIMAAHMALAAVVFWLFVRMAGEFEERAE